jgi:3-phenylpropionate/trans-cinnamate dioxygenase ferredoxin reductase component
MSGIVIAGGGLTAARIAQSYRESGGSDPITLLASEPHPPYHRPPLTKRLLRGEAEPPDTFVATPEDFRELGVALRLDNPVASLDLAARTVTLETGDAVPYERLAIATGATPRTLPVPGAELEGVRTLRTLDDSLRVREEAASAGRVVVIGTGFIGLEVTSSLRMRGVEVTIVDAATAPFQALGAPIFSDFLTETYREHGVELLLGDGIEELSGDGHVRSVRTSSGHEVEADLVVVGVGVTAATAWLDGSGLALDNGVVVDSSFHASAEDVFAAGDVANFEDPVFKRRRRIEHWSNADYQGRLLGKVLAGEDVSYDRVSAFFTELFGNVYRFFGDGEGASRQEVEGSFEDGRAIVRYFDRDLLRAALATGLSDEEQEELETRIRKDAAGVRSEAA